MVDPVMEVSVPTSGLLFFFGVRGADIRPDFPQAKMGAG
jgi:hypothetical protein